MCTWLQIQYPIREVAADVATGAMYMERSTAKLTLFLHRMRASHSHTRSIQWRMRRFIHILFGDDDDNVHTPLFTRHCPSRVGSPPVQTVAVVWTTMTTTTTRSAPSPAYNVLYRRIEIEEVPESHLGGKPQQCGKV